MLTKCIHGQIAFLHLGIHGLVQLKKTLCDTGSCLCKVLFIVQVPERRQKHKIWVSPCGKSTSQMHVLVLLKLFACWLILHAVLLLIFEKNRNVSMGHGCPLYRQIRINRALSLTKGHNSNDNRWILSVIELDLYFMITYLCMKYESNTPTYSKDIARIKLDLFL